MIRIDESSRRYFCRASECNAYSDGNVPYGYCDRHLALFMANVPIVDKLGLPPAGSVVTPRLERTVEQIGKSPEAILIRLWASHNATFGPTFMGLSDDAREKLMQEREVALGDAIQMGGTLCARAFNNLSVQQGSAKK